MKRTIFSKMMALLFVVTLLSSMLCIVPSVAADGEPIISVGTETAVRGGTATVPLSITNGVQAGGFNLKLTYDASKVDITTDDIESLLTLSESTGLMAQKNVVIDGSVGEIYIALASRTGFVMSDDKTDLFNLTFTVKNDAAAGTMPIVVDVEEMVMPSTGNTSPSVIATVVEEDGAITINGGTAQDIVSVTADPATLQYYTYEKSLAEVQAALGSTVNAVVGTAPNTQTIPVSVTWDNGAYDEAAEGVYTFTGTLVNLPANVTNSTNLTATARVTLSDRVVLSVSPVLAEVAYNTAFAAVGLPLQVNITAEGNASYTANVTWDGSTYNPLLTGIVQSISGTLTLPQGVKQGQNEVYATAAITVLPQSVTPGPVIGGGTTGGSVSTNPYDHAAYVYGYQDGTFMPGKSITRAEMAAIVHRVMQNFGWGDVVGAQASFNDVAGHWAYNDIAVLTYYGILNGYPDGSFRPNANITRAEFATIAASLVGLAQTSGSAFGDVAGHWAEQYIYAVNEAGLMIGYNGNEFRPQNALTRAETVTTINRMLGRNPEHYTMDRVTSSPFSDVDASHWAYYEILEAALDHRYTIVNGKENWFKLQ